MLKSCVQKFEPVSVVKVSTWLQLKTFLLEHRKLSTLANEQAEGIVILIEAAKGDAVGVEVQGESQPVHPPHLRLHLLHVHLVPLHVPDKLPVLRRPQGLARVECTAHS